MKPVLLFLASILFIFSSSAQGPQRDSINSEITALEKLKSEISAKVDLLSDQLTQQFSLQQGVKAKIEQLEVDLRQHRDEYKRLQAKNQLTSQEKKSFDTFRKMQGEKDKLAKSFFESEERYNKKLVSLDQALGLRNELEEKIQQLKSQHQSK